MRSSLARTVLLGCLAAGAGIWWLGRAYEVEDSMLLGHLLASIAFVAGLAVLGIAGAAGVGYLRRRRLSREGPRQGGSC